MTIILKDGQNIPPEAYGSVTALGNFDGVHRGHAYLIKQLRQHSKGKRLSVVTFEPHPREFFSRDQKKFRLTNADERNKALSDLGIDYIFQYTFDAQFAALSGYDFIHKILHNQLDTKHVVCGEQFAFGNNRVGSVRYLGFELKKLKIGFSAVKPLTDSSGIISSSRIRHLLKTGHPHEAQNLLGRAWAIENIVQHGEQRGRTLGFPTANLSLGNHLEPKCGVYAVTVQLPNATIYNGVANIGYRPTIGVQPVCSLEVHIFDFDADLYGKLLKITFHHFIREEKKYNSIAALKMQIEKDAQQSKYFLDTMNVKK
ncbi:Bifunctional riboflavin kinase/FMN adenylyltransferase [Commensalibacter sp. Nvir]|uniref:bifunctional riboflavin kinase/FAD synthetase n=1 Tax=Commensalibacter sp. Nvir TaxID=3069817 RepID=UPI002D61262B|nr:Bifunctional riboflavin kinase/FMN adenylyltransferase [Commensalibacter sp. Nvir]